MQHFVHCDHWRYFLPFWPGAAVNRLEADDDTINKPINYYCVCRAAFGYTRVCKVSRSHLWCTGKYSHYSKPYLSNATTTTTTTTTVTTIGFSITATANFHIGIGNYYYLKNSFDAGAASTYYLLVPNHFLGHILASCPGKKL